MTNAYIKERNIERQYREMGWMSPITTDAPCCEAAVYAQGAADK